MFDKTNNRDDITNINVSSGNQQKIGFLAGIPAKIVNTIKVLIVCAVVSTIFIANTNSVFAGAPDKVSNIDITISGFTIKGTLTIRDTNGDGEYDSWQFTAKIKVPWLFGGGTHDVDYKGKFMIIAGGNQLMEANFNIHNMINTFIYDDINNFNFSVPLTDQDDNETGGFVQFFIDETGNEALVFLISPEVPEDPINKSALLDSKVDLEIKIISTNNNEIKFEFYSPLDYLPFYIYDMKGNIVSKFGWTGKGKSITWVDSLSTGVCFIYTPISKEAVKVIVTE